MKSLPTCLGILALVVNAIAIIVTGMRYLAHRTRAARQAGKSWGETMADDTKLATGSVWLDGAIFALLPLGPIDVFVYQGYFQE